MELLIGKSFNVFCGILIFILDDFNINKLLLFDNIFFVIIFWFLIILENFFFIWEIFFCWIKIDNFLFNNLLVVIVIKIVIIIGIKKLSIFFIM